MGFQGKPSARGAYDAIVYIDGSEVVAEDANGRKIARGVAGTEDGIVITAALSFSAGKTLMFVSGSYGTATLYTMDIPSHTTIIFGNCSFNNVIMTFNNVHAIDIIGPATFTCSVYESFGFYISNGSHDINFSDLRVANPYNLACAFSIVNNSLTPIENIRFNDCHVYDSEGIGFYIGGDGTGETIVDGVYYFEKKVNNVWLNGCSARRCGYTTHRHDAVCGFDLCEGAEVSNLFATDCYAGENCSDGFHVEGFPRNLCIDHCISENNGVHPIDVPPSGLLESGRGFCVPSGVHVSNCISRSNTDGYAIGGTTASAGILPHSIVHCEDHDSRNSGLYFWAGTNRPKQVLTIDGLSIWNSLKYGIYMLGGYHVYGRDIHVYNPTGDGTYCNLLTGGFNDIEIYTDSPAQLIANNISGLNNSIIRGGVRSSVSTAAYSIVSSCSDLSFEDLIIDLNATGSIGIFASVGTMTNVNVKNVTFRNTYGSGLLTHFVRQNSWVSGNIVVDRKTMKLILPRAQEVYDVYVRFSSNSGSSTGTGSEQTIAHGLAAIPTGCKAWIKYLVGTRYITEMVPFDATNIYPTVESGVAYEWRIE